MNLNIRWLKISIATQALLAIYFQAILWLPLGGWNYQPGFEPLLAQAIQDHLEVTDALGGAAFLLPALLFWLAYRKDLLWLMWTCAGGYSVWLVLQIQTWWVAYIFGASDRWVEVYERVFSHSTQILPSFGRHLPPDGMHFVLQLILASVVLSTMIALVQRLREQRAQRDSAGAPEKGSR